MSLVPYVALVCRECGKAKAHVHPEAVLSAPFVCPPCRARLEREEEWRAFFKANVRLHPNGQVDLRRADDSWEPL